jgi:hypothetical protein
LTHSIFPEFLNNIFISQMEGKLGGMPLRQQMAAVKPRVERLRALKFARVKHFAEVVGAINRLEEELFGTEDVEKAPAVPQEDLTIRRLEELREKLKELQEEKVRGSRVHFPGT